MADIIPLVISYPDFKLNDVMDSEQFDTNNSQIVVKVNEIKDKVNAIINGTGVSDLSIVNGKIADGAITSRTIMDGTIVTADLADGVITSAKIVDGTIVTGDIADSAVTSAKIADGTIVNGDIADSAITSAKILDGTITTLDLADSIITSAKIQDGAIVNVDINNAAAIDASKIATGVVSNAEFITLDGVTSPIQTQLNAKQPLDSTLSALAAYNTNGIMVQTAVDTFAGRTLIGTGNRIAITNADGIIGNPTIDVGTDVVTLTGVQTLTNKTITGTFNGNLNGTANNVTTNANLTGNVTSIGNATTIPASTITSAMIVDGTIVSGDLADNAVTSAKILDGTIVNADINLTAAIDASKIATGVVSNAEFITLDGVTSGIQAQLDGKTPTSHVGSGGAAHAVAVAGGAAGFISGANQLKLDNIASGAQVNGNAFSTISVAGQSDVVADNTSDTLTLAGGIGIVLTTDPVTDTLTITASGATAPGAHASTHVTGGSDVIADAVAGGNSGLLSGADKTNLNSLVTYTGVIPYGLTTGTSSAYVVTTAPLVTIQNGTTITVRMHIANAGTTPQINVNGFGLANILISDDRLSPAGGTFTANKDYTLRFNGATSDWSVISGVGFAKIDSQTFTGSPSLPTLTTGTTQSVNDNSNRLSTTAYVDRHVVNYSTHVPYAVVTGSVNAYVATLSPIPNTLTGLGISININITNTLTSTLNVNGLGAKTILDAAGNALTSGALVAGNIYTLRYNGTAFQIQGAIALGAGIDATKIADGSVTSTEFQYINSLTSNVQTQLDNKQGLDATLAKFKSGNSTYTDNDNAQTFTDAFCTAASLVTISITSATAPQGVWTVTSAVGSFTITSTVAETNDITFDYYIQKVV